MPHVDSGAECLVAHFDGNGHFLPQCRKCANCQQWIRPEDMGNECPKAEGK